MQPINLLSIGIAADHAGVKLKDTIINHLDNLKVMIYDFGTFSSKSVDYPDYAHPLALAVEKGECDFGIAICGTGNGVNIVVNHHQKIRGALCWTAEIAKLARLHNNANIISLPARFVSPDIAIQMVETFLTTDFDGGRHQIRIDKIACRT
jgi:ribose 5-phosphate isomerase B